MDRLVLTAIGDDRAGLVGALSGVIASHKGNWEQSQMAELLGKFAGIVVVSVPGGSSESLIADLDRLESAGLLHLTVERATVTEAEAEQAGSADTGHHRFAVSVVGQDHTGIVHEISQALADAAISIEQLETSVEPAPMGGTMFRAEAVVEAPEAIDLSELQDLVERVAGDLIVDVEGIDG